MPDVIRVSAPSRVCLFGEHQDYLGLDVIAAAIDLRFYARISGRSDQKACIAIRDSRLDQLNAGNPDGSYDYLTVDLDQPIMYAHHRDYLRSTLNVLRRNGCINGGFDATLDSEIPIGKGMCSSSTMIVVLIKAILEWMGHPAAQEPRQIADWAFQAEVSEFGEPGGQMDHIMAAHGGLLHLTFANPFTYRSLAGKPGGCLILFDSLQQKETTRVLAGAKIPTLAAVEALKVHGIDGIRDLAQRPDAEKLAGSLPEKLSRPLLANLENKRLLTEGLRLLTEQPTDDVVLGRMISQHHAQLRDGLGISTPVIEEILDCATAHGAWGGKINGSGGGGCCFVTAPESRADEIIDAVQSRGYPARRLHIDTGARRENNHESDQ
ncbi:MAG: hypothetical protein EOM13_00240 [Clostridia bacterium]|nr:hypothetical protein [Clostridia bacterium]